MPPLRAITNFQLFLWHTRPQAEGAVFQYINDGVDAPPGGIAMCQNDRGSNCHAKGEHPWRMLA
jgi:hypothetical protein